MRWRPRGPLGLLALVVVALLVTRCGDGGLVGGRADDVPAGAIPAGAQAGVVEKVVDGDTIWVRVDEPGGPLVHAATHKIRLLEIDTPETVDPGRDVQCGGPEATGFAEDMIGVGTTVHLLADREDTDRYGRFLRYVWTDDGVFYNLEAVRQGYARAVLYEPNDAYIDMLRAAEAEARDTGRGIWGDWCPAPPR